MVGRNPVDSPVEVGSLSQYTSQVVGLGISSINRMGDLFLKTEWRLPQRPVIFVQRTLTFVLKQARVKRSLQVIEIILPRYCQNHPPVEPPEVLSLGQQPSPKKRFSWEVHDKVDTLGETLVWENTFLECLVGLYFVF